VQLIVMGDMEQDREPVGIHSTFDYHGLAPDLQAATPPRIRIMGIATYAIMQMGWPMMGCMSVRL